MQFNGAWELKILTSKKVDCLLLSQKFWTLMSSLAPSSVLVPLRGKLSPVSGWSVGSTQTFGHTSVRSLIALCRMEGMAPFGQLKAWLTLNVWLREHYVTAVRCRDKKVWHKHACLKILSWQPEYKLLHFVSAWVCVFHDVTLQCCRKMCLNRVARNGGCEMGNQYFVWSTRKMFGPAIGDEEPALVPSHYMH